MLERFHDYLERSFLPGRRSGRRPTSTPSWPGSSPRPTRGGCGCWAARPGDRVGADRAAMLPLPPVAAGGRLAGDDAAAARSLRPARLQRLLRAPGRDRPPDRGPRRPRPGVGDLRGRDRGRPRPGVGRHQTITDFEHAVAAKLLRHGRADLLRPVADRTPATVPPGGGRGPLTGYLRRRARPRRRPGRATGRWAVSDGHTHHDDRTTRTGRDVTSELEYLTRALKAPTLRDRSTGWPNAPARSPGPMRSSWPPACNARSPPASPTAARAGSAPPGSRPARASRTSTTTTPAA